MGGRYSHVHVILLYSHVPAGNSAVSPRGILPSGSLFRSKSAACPIWTEFRMQLQQVVSSQERRLMPWH